MRTLWSILCHDVNDDDGHIVNGIVSMMINDTVNDDDQ